MSSGPSVVVNKGGFLSALVRGVSGIVIVVVLCGTALGLYGIRLADKYVSGVTFGTLQGIPELVRSLPDWQTLPPIVAEPLNDRRALDYREQLHVVTQFRRVERDSGRDDGVVQIEVTNAGDEVVSLLMVRVLAEDESVEHIERQYLLATPVACDEFDWMGPLPAGETRRVVLPMYRVVGEVKLTVETADVRVWNGPVAKPESEGLAARSPVSAAADMPAWLSD